MKKILTFVFAISLIFTFGCKDDTNNASNQNNDTTLYPGYEEFTVDDNTKNNEKDTSELNIMQEEPENTEPTNDNVMVENDEGTPVPATNEDLEDETKSFYIIVGSYEKDQNAQEKMKQFKKEGYAAQVLPKFGKHNRVSVVSFNDEKAARAELKTLRAKYKDSSYWLLYR